ncbi:phage holin, LLH family [Desulfuromonas acetoxidans]|uniref:phage holin, LLH family n=1 Tax=Desulfuromonas acetoxidans TaxID=891 RepID=UPI00292D3A24|nr:phage holin, LLH family [Desulfuromonas acetoxidans]
MSRFKLFFSSAWSFLKPFVSIFMSAAGPVLADAATKAVKATAQSLADGSGSDKRQAAYDLIVDDLKSQGVALGTTVTTSMINAAIEAAVQGLKSA